MIIAESKDLHDAFLDRLKAKYALVSNRSEDGKLHLSDLTHCLTATYWDGVDFIPPTDEQALIFARGWLLEDFSIADIHVEPFEVDGVWMTVDMLLDGLPGDLKSTLMSPTTSGGCKVCGEPYTGHSKAANGHAYERGEPLPFVFPPEWSRRFAAYRHALNQLHGGWGVGGSASQRFGVVVFHLIQATVRAYELRWAPSELEEAWAWVLARKDNLRRMRVTESPEPFAHNEDYECPNCPYLLRCQLQASLENLVHA